MWEACGHVLKLGIDVNIPPSLVKGHSGQNTAEERKNKASKTSYLTLLLKFCWLPFVRHSGL